MALPFLPQDKANHFAYGVALGFAARCVCLFLDAPAAAHLAPLFVSATIGALKEGIDNWQNAKARVAGLPLPHGVEGWDWAATALGGLVVTMSSYP
jgi:hypothetical protein